MSNYYNIIKNEFIIGFKMQEGWGLFIALYFLFCGTGAGLFLVSLLFLHSPIGIILDLFLLGFGALILFFDLGNRWRFWRAFSKPQSSWISRGTYLITFLFLFDFFYLLMGSPSLPFWVTVFMTLIAVLVILYPGFVLSFSPSISIWNHSFIPVLFGLHSLVNSLCIGGLIGPLNEIERSPMLSILIWMFVILLIGTFVFLMVSYASNTGSRKSISLIFQGKLGLYSTIIGIGVGLIIPLLLLLFLRDGLSWEVFLILCILRVGGDLGFRYSILKVGVYEPFV